MTMAGSSAARSKRQPDKGPGGERLYDRELEDLPAELRWREWMLRVEAVIFASAEPVSRETLARVVGRDCSIDLLIDDLREELSSRPYELVSVAGGWQHRTRPRFAETIRASSAPTRGGAAALSEFEAMVLMAVGYFQPVTRGELSKIFGKEVSRDIIAALRGAGFIGSGPRSPTPGAPYTYVTTQHFLSAFGMETLRDLPNIEALEDAGLLSRHAVQNEIAAFESGESETDEEPSAIE
jgi:segregation and condensation protein B